MHSVNFNSFWVKLGIFTCIFFVQVAEAQDTLYARKIIDTLSSSSFHGRGYVNKGDSLAADFIVNEFKKLQLRSFSNGYFQPVSFAINTFPSHADVAIDEKKLHPGQDFMVSAFSNSVTGDFELVYLKKKHIKNKNAIQKFIYSKPQNCFIVIDKNKFKKPLLDFVESFKQTNFLKAKGYIQINDNHLNWSISNGRKLGDYPYVMVNRNAIPKKSKKATIYIESKYFYKYPTQNVMAYIQGAVQPDSFIVFTAHYDHLGQMGSEVFFPGANDNASGTAMLLNLAQYFSNPEEKPYYSIAFIGFTGEEAGLLGSKFYNENPVFPLKSIKFLFNLDMVGTGKQGITVVNATAFPNEFNRLKALNDTVTMFPEIKKREEAANSDHYFFYKNGVPCFFIYSFGGSPAYHDIYDVAAAIDLGGFSKLTKLLINYVHSIPPTNNR